LDQALVDDSVIPESLPQARLFLKCHLQLPNERV
jgi:hypothetical protein